MKAIVLAATLVLFGTLPSAFAAPLPGTITSLRDLPALWTGVAGDLFHQTSAELKIERILGEERVPGPITVIAYDVDATLKVGNRSIHASKITLMRLNQSSQNADLVVHLEDELVAVVSLNVRRDAETGRFTAKDTLARGARQFSLSGAL